MASIAPGMTRLELAPRRAMFALELIDPIRGGRVAEGLAVTAEGLRPPTLTPSNRFVWLDRDPPARQRIRIRVVATSKMFAPFEELIDVPAHVPGLPAAALTIRRRLKPTGLYEPPSGLIAVGGMLVEDEGAASPVADVGVRINFRHTEGTETFTGGYTAFTDSRGGFIAVVRGLGDIRPDPDLHSPATFGAWLMLKRGSEVRASQPLSLRLGRLTRIPEPLKWAALRRRDIDEDEFVHEQIGGFGR